MPNAPAPLFIRPLLDTEDKWSGYAVEFWVVSKSYASATIASFLSAVPGDGVPGAAWTVELPGRSREAPGQPGRLKFTHRVGGSGDDAVSVFSQPMFMPFRWHHVVAQRGGGRLELFLDGVLAASMPMTALLPLPALVCRG